MLHFSNSYQILNNLNKKIALIAFVLMKLDTAKNVVSWTSKIKNCKSVSKKPHFTTHFDIQNVKGSQAQMKSGRQRFYYIF